MQQCDRCGEANPSDASFCATCGLALADPSGVTALVNDSAPEDAPVRSSESVEAPAFGETAPVVSPLSDSIDDLPPTAPPAAGVPTTAMPGGPGPAAEATAVVVPRSGGDPSGPYPTPVSESRSAGVMVAALAVAVVVIVGGVFVLLASNSDDEDTSSTVTRDSAPATVAPSTEPAVSTPPATAEADVEAPVTVVAVTEPLPSPPPTLVPGSTRAVGDLGLEQPILDEACDGRYITFVGSAVGAEPYAGEVASLLVQYPGSNYIWTKACPSLRQEFRDGNDIYGVVFGPYITQQEACDAVSFGPPDAYVRRISTTDPQDHTVDC